MSKTLSESAAEILRASMNAGKEPMQSLNAPVEDLGGQTPEQLPTAVGAAASANMKPAAKPGTEGTPAEPIKKSPSAEKIGDEEESLKKNPVDGGTLKVEEEELSDEEIEQMVAEMSEEELDELISEMSEEDAEELVQEMGTYPTKAKKGTAAKPLLASGEKLTKLPEEAEKEDEEEEDEDEEDAKKSMQKEMVEKFRGSMREDVDALFNGESLSEDFRVKATLIFETAVQTRIEQIVEEMFTKNEAVLAEAVEEIKSDMAEQVDEYLNYVVEQWMEENEVAIETGLRAELVDDFIGGLRNLFAEHYVEIPDEKVDVAEELAVRIVEMEDALAEQASEVAALTEQVNAVKKEKAIIRACENLTQVQAEKMKSLAESVEFTAEGDFDNKLAVIRENYFPSKVTVTSEVKVIQESAVESPEVAEVVNSRMNRYVQSLHKTAPKA